MNDTDANINLNAILWLKSELDKTLNDARSSLDHYIDNPSDLNSGKDALALYKLAYGVLKMARIRGGELLLQELIAVMDELLAGRLRRRDDALDTVMQATAQLPDYLEYLQAGHADVPIVLLPLLNDMRASRDAELLSDSILELAELSNDSEFYANRKSSGEPVEQLAKGLHGIFQKSLLDWYQDRDTSNNLLKLAAIFFRLGNASKGVNSRRLWLVSQSVVEAIQCGDLETSIAVKTLLGKVDRQMKNLINTNEEEFDQSIPLELVKNLLFYVAAANSGNKTVDRVKEVYKLNALLPDGGSVETARANLRGAGKNIYRSLTKAVDDEINVIKERLEVYAFADQPAVDMLMPVVDKLNGLAETVGMLSRNRERENLLQASARLDKALSAESVLTREEIQDLASLLVDVEISVKGFVGEKTSNDEIDVHEQEYRKVYYAVVQETLAELGKVRAATIDYLDRYKNHDLLAPLPGLLKNIRGALALLPLMSVEPLLSKMDRFVANLITKKHQPTDMQLSAFADGLASIELYLESLEPGVGDQKNILEIGKASVAQLEVPMLPEEAGENQSAFVESVMPESPVEAAGIALTSADASMVEMLEKDAMSADQQIGDMEDTLVVDRSAILEEEERAAAEALGDEDTPLLVPDASSVDLPMSDNHFAELQILPASVDQEILEIFLEEAEEEQQKIADSLGHWIADTSDREALSIIRRSFHTLKGSGRLVGAEVMGEFAWAFEKLLNRVMDESIAPTVEVFATLESARDLLPGLIAQITTRERPEQAVASTARHADILVRGGSLDAQHDRKGEMPADLTIIVDSDDQEDTDFDEGESQSDMLRNTMDDVVDDGSRPDLRQDALIETGLQKFPTLGLGLDETNEYVALSESEIDGETLEPKVADTVNIRSVILSEVEEQLEYIDAQVQKVTEYDTELNADAELLNSIQTLNNVARTADIPSIYNVFSDLEKYLEHCAKFERKLAPSFPDLLGRASQHANDVLGSLRGGVQIPADNEEAIRELKGLLDDARESVEQESEQTQQQARVELEVEQTLNVEVLDISEPSPAESIEDITTSVSQPIMESQNFDQQSPDIINSKDAELIGIFLEEACEILDASYELTSRWVDQVDDNILVKELQRHLHTLKGGARMAGIDNIGNLAHSIESIFDNLMDGKIDGTAEVIHLVQTSYDMLGTMISAAEKGQPIFPATGLQQDIQDIVASNEGHLDSQKPQIHQTPNVGTPSYLSADTQVTDPYDEIEEVQPELETEPTPIIVDTHDTAETPVESFEQYTSDDVLTTATLTGSTNSTSSNERLPRQDSIKVNAVLLDELVNQAGEINIFHSRIDEQIKQTNSRLEELQQTIVRLSAQLRKLENEAEAQILSTFNKDEKFDPDMSTISSDFDPLELDRYSTIQQLSRSLAESISDLTSLEEMVSDNLKDLETLLLQKSRISTDLQEGLMRTRLVPFSIQLPRFQRVVRRTASELNKEVELVISGENSELDRKLLDSMVSPLEHFLRNSIAHGIELPEERLAAGKSRQGKIEINIKRSGPEIELLVSDDGAGIDVEKVREKAIAGNLLQADADLSDEDVLQFILESGLSTASSVDQISGRGVGLDVVNHEIKKLNGDLRISSERGVGTRFRINLPFSLAINQSLMIQAGDDVFAVPVTSIYGVIRMQPDKIAEQLALDEPIIDYGGSTYALRHLGSTLNHKVVSMNTAEEQLPLLLVNTGEYRVAFLVDSVLGSREIVVKPLGPPLSNLIEYSGATIMGDGSVALILDMPGVARSTSTGKSQLTNAAASQQERPLVMVVDDSITIRKVTTRILERNEYQVITAKDGVDAQRQLTDFVPAIILLDVEMPRMDGFELATKLRQSEEHKHVPIIMITSRTGKKHKERAAKIGVDRYLGKPFQEERLLEEISALLASEGSN